MIISILITASGLLGFLLTILSLFFEVIPKEKKRISKKDMGYIILWLALAIIGIVNIYYTVNNKEKIGSNNQKNSIQEINNQEVSNNNDESYTEQETNADNIDSNLSEEELIIKQNFDLIQQLKAEYSDEDIKIIENDNLDFYFYEKAGYIYKDLLKMEVYDILAGIQMTSTKIIILDYLSDDIIYVYTPENNYITYYPDNQNKFYCIIYHDDYNIYVTSPIQVIGGDGYNYTGIYMNKKGSEYTQLFKTHLYMKNSKSNEPYILISDNFDVQYSFNKKYSDEPGMSYYMVNYDSGLLPQNGYFSLNTEYVIEICIYDNTDDSTLLDKQTVNGSVTNSNLIDVYFNLENQTDTSQ